MWSGQNVNYHIFTFTHGRRVYFSALLFSAGKQIIAYLHTLSDKIDRIEQYVTATKKNDESMYCYFLQ